MVKALIKAGKDSYTFDYAPENIKISTATALSSNLVLDTNEPDIRHRGISTTIKIGKSLLISQGLLISQQAKLDRLKQLRYKRQFVSFVYNTVVVKKAAISSLEYTIKTFTNGKPSHVEVDIELVVANQYENNTPEKLRSTKPKPPPAKKYTDREAIEKATKIRDILKNPANRTRFNIGGKYSVDVGTDGSVAVNTDGKKKPFKLSDFGIK